MNTHLYVVTLVSRSTGAMHKILVESPCPGGMQEFVDELCDLPVCDPVVVDIEESPALLSAIRRSAAP